MWSSVQQLADSTYRSVASWTGKLTKLLVIYTLNVCKWDFGQGYM